MYLDHNPVGGVFFTTAPKDSQTAANAGKQSLPAAAAPTTKPQAWQIQFVPEHDKYIGVHVPFWIVRVPSDIIDNHGGIWSDNNMALMAAIFRMHRPLQTLSSPRPRHPKTRLNNREWTRINTNQTQISPQRHRVSGG